jgi:hypothetical protein
VTAVFSGQIDVPYAYEPLATPGMRNLRACLKVNF